MGGSPPQRPKSYSDHSTSTSLRGAVWDSVDCVITRSSPVFNRSLQRTRSCARYFGVASAVCAAAGMYERPLRSRFHPKAKRTAAQTSSFLREGWSGEVGVVASNQCARPDEPSADIGGGHVGPLASPMALSANALA